MGAGCPAPPPPPPPEAPHKKSGDGLASKRVPIFVKQGLLLAGHFSYMALGFKPGCYPLHFQVLQLASNGNRHGPLEGPVCVCSSSLDLGSLEHISRQQRAFVSPWIHGCRFETSSRHFHLAGFEKAPPDPRLCRSEARWWTSEGVPTIQEAGLPGVPFFHRSPRADNGRVPRFLRVYTAHLSKANGSVD